MMKLHLPTKLISQMTLGTIYGMPVDQMTRTRQVYGKRMMMTLSAKLPAHDLVNIVGNTVRVIAGGVVVVIN